jgi:hypothetical protein
LAACCCPRNCFHCRRRRVVSESGWHSASDAGEEPCTTMGKLCYSIRQTGHDRDLFLTL